MKSKLALILLILSHFFFSQNNESGYLFQFKNAKSDNQKIIASIKLAEYYIEIDADENCQNFINKAKKCNLNLNNDEYSSIIHSLQTELFYYLGLYDFGLYESKKCLKSSLKINDSLLISDAYFFSGLHFFELENYKNSEEHLLKSLQYFPNKYKSNPYHNLINKEHIFNNLAQVYIESNNVSKAKKLNQLAYTLALKSNSKRGIPNIENTFGKIYLKENKKDSAQFMFKKSIVNSLKYNYYDLQLLNLSGLIEVNKSNENCLIYYKQAQILIKTKPINNNFKEQFYQDILPIFKQKKDISIINDIQEKIIELNNKINKVGNKHLQNITNYYIKSEQEAMTYKNNAIQNENKIIKIQFTILSFSLLLFVVFILMVYRSKYQTQKKLLHQKNEINASLHDDIGSDLSSIQFNSQTLLQNLHNDELSEKLTQKIKIASQDVSQKLKTFIWALDDTKDTLSSIVEYIKTYTFQYFQNTEIKINFSDNVGYNALKIDGFTRKHLFLTVKECLNNILKHSKATEADVSIGFPNNYLKIVIHDNGIGINSKNPFGNGLNNIQKRIERLNGIIEIINENGTKIKIKVMI